MTRTTLYETINGLNEPDSSVFVAIAEVVESGPAPVSFRRIVDSARIDIPSLTNRQADRALARLTKRSYLRIVDEADGKAQKCRVWALGGGS